MYLKKLKILNLGLKNTQTVGLNRKNKYKRYVRLVVVLSLPEMYVLIEDNFTSFVALPLTMLESIAEAKFSSPATDRLLLVSCSKIQNLPFGSGFIFAKGTLNSSCR